MEYRQKLGLVIEVVEQLALEGIHVAPFELRRGNKAVVRRLQLVLMRFVPIEHIAHDGTSGVERSARHLRSDLFLEMGIEALERTMGEIAHLQRAEALIEPFEAQTTLSEPLVRAFQIAFNLRGREARLVDHLAGHYARQHDKRALRRRHLA